MSLRFHNSLSLFPGIRLHVSGRGLSVTVGVPGASVNFGPGGQTLNLGLPGTGISFRQRLSEPAHEPGLSEWRYPESRFAPPETSTIPGGMPGEIRSAHVGQLTSPDLEGLKRLVNEAASKRRNLSTQLASDISARDAAWRSLERSRKFPLHPFASKRLPTLEATFKERKAQVEQRAAEHDACHVQMDFAFGDEALDAYRALSAAHLRLARSQKVWDVTASVAIDRVALRTTASTLITRTPTSLAVANSGIVASRWSGLGFGNANGEDIEIFPGFCLVCDRRGGSGDFAIVDLRDLHMEAVPVRFVESEGVPSDAKVVGHNWEKANKDGSRDRRFANNHQIPVALYGRITLRSPGGVHEAWMFSDHDAVEEFGACYRRLQQALADLARKATSGAEADDLPFAPAEPINRYAVPPLPQVGGAHEYTAGAVALLGAALWFGSAHLAANPFVPPGAYFPSSDPAAPALQAAAPAGTPAVMPAKAAVPVPLSAALPAVVAPSQTALPDGERVVTKQGANVRSDASGSAAVVRTVARGISLRVHDRRNGWVQVGDGSPWGWVHISLLEAVR
ncbi:MAG TPA: DUF4236 domain-containing protein [Roseomonas sp.]|nr:DUF4236 domain-containing protein [Roseomonas sp.]